MPNDIKESQASAKKRSGESFTSADSKSRFSDRVENYIKYRPHYPKQVVEVLRERIHLRPDWVIADVGCGTGISCELFLENGNEVIGVEPNAPMREAATQLLSRYSNFKAIDGSAEATNVPSRSVDLVIAAQAFHWFDREAFGRECARILKPGGFILLMWNDRKLKSDRFAEDYEALLQQYATDYRDVNHQNIGTDIIGAFFGGPYESVLLPNHQEFDFEGVKGRLLSSSYVPAPGHPNHEPILQGLRQIFDENARDGSVRIEYDTQMFFRLRKKSGTSPGEGQHPQPS